MVGEKRVRRAPFLLLLVSVTSAKAEPIFSYRNPLHADQCAEAIREAEKALDQDPESRSARLLLAEGLLCRGLQEDPWALDAAITELGRLVASEPRDFFAQLELADALRKRFPVSAEAETALERTRDLLERTDVGAARSELATYITNNLDAVRAGRAAVRPAVAANRAAFSAGALTAAEVAAFAGQLSLFGPAGLEEAEQILKAPRQCQSMSGGEGNFGTKVGRKQEGRVP